MSLSYTIDKLREMRAAAGLGTLSMGVCAISGELVSSTPIPGSRCGHDGQNPADYGGYLLGEGMTPAAALYLANLHNWFPSMAEAIPETADPQGDTAYLKVIQQIAESHGWIEWKESLSEWIQGRLQGMDLVQHLHRQRDFSMRTFGPGPRTAGVLDHIRKELAEIEAHPQDLTEWIDVVLLALDGAWRSGYSPEQIAEGLQAKQAKNEARTWPDWRTADTGKAIEHVRIQEVP